METHEHSEGRPQPLWSPQELKHFEERLLSERKRALEQMAQFDEELATTPTEAEGTLTNWPFHLADEGTNTYEREQTYLLATREGRLLWLIDEALRRLYKSPETYGRCDSCGMRISYERLDAIPYAVRCVDCKQQWESGRAD